MRRRTADRRAAGRERGYTLIALVVFLIVMNIAVATAMMLWSKVIQRSDEAELVFRGLQYAEAIRVFEQRFGRPPNQLDELLELEPRSIRQLWTDPLSDSGEWEPLLAGAGSQGTDLTGAGRPGEESGGESGGEPGDESSAEALERQLDAGPGGSRPGTLGGRRPGARPGAAPGLSGSDREAPSGPIEGVRPTAEGEAMRSFLGQTSYEKWEFRAQLLAAPPVSPEGNPLSPRIDPDALGRPFPSWLRSVPGSPPHPTGGRGDTGAFEDEDDDG